MATSKVTNLASALYRYHYGVGIHTIRLFRRFGRWLGRITAPARRVCRYIWRRRVVLPVHRLGRRIRNVWGQMRPAGQLLKENFKKNPLSVIPCFFRLCRSAVRHYWDELTAVGRLAGPVAAATVLTATILAWVNTDFCLNLTYQNENLGVVENAAVYDRGAALARGRVINADNSFVVDDVPTLIDHVHGSFAKGRMIRSDLTSEDCYIAKLDGCFAHGETLKKARAAVQEKLFDDMPEEYRIAAFVQAFPDPKKPVDNRELFDWHHRLTGSCEMGRKAFVKDRGLSLDGETTVEEFIRLTENAYGGATIRRLKEAYR